MHTTLHQQADYNYERKVRANKNKQVKPLRWHSPNGRRNSSRSTLQFCPLILGSSEGLLIAEGRRQASVGNGRRRLLGRATTKKNPEPK